MNEEKPSKFQIHFPVLLVPCAMKKTFKKKFCLWTLEIIQFIRFEKHMDGPRYLNFFLGYLIIYLSIWYSMSHGCFTARNMLKCKEKRELRVLFKTVQDQIRKN